VDISEVRLILCVAAMADSSQAESYCIDDIKTFEPCSNRTNTFCCSGRNETDAGHVIDVTRDDVDEARADRDIRTGHRVKDDEAADRCCESCFTSKLVFFGHRPNLFLNYPKILSHFGHNVRKYRLVDTVTASFNTITGQ